MHLIKFISDFKFVFFPPYGEGFRLWLIFRLQVASPADAEIVQWRLGVHNTVMLWPVISLSDVVMSNCPRPASLLYDSPHTEGKWNILMQASMLFFSSVGNDLDLHAALSSFFARYSGAYIT